MSSCFTILIDDHPPGGIDPDIISALNSRGYNLVFDHLENADCNPNLIILDVHRELTSDRLNHLQHCSNSGSALAGLWALKALTKFTSTSNPNMKSLIATETFQSAFVTTTGFDTLDIEYLSLLLRDLGARINMNFTKDITHLIVNKVGSAKHSAALRTGKHCLTKQWVLQCFQQGSLLSIDEFPVPSLFGMKISVSQLDVSDRNRIRDQIETNGGTYSPNLSYNCTHLICKQPQGAKYKFAMESNIPIVTEQWLDAMIQNQGCLDNRPFLLSSSPTALSVELMPSITAIGANPSPIPTSLLVDIIEYDPACDNYLSGCVAVLIGFTDSHLYDRLLRILDYAGATYLNQMRSFVTHAIIAHAGATPASANHCRSVSSQWLFDCYKAKRCVPITDAHRPASLLPFQSMDESNLFRATNNSGSSRYRTLAAVSFSQSSSGDLTETVTATAAIHTLNHSQSITGAPTNFSFFNQTLDSNAIVNKRRKLTWR